VVGAGISGLMSAAALRNAADEVVVIERDNLPDQPVARRGVPQSEQLHNLLGRAQAHLEDLMPGFGAALHSLGCGDGSVSTDTHVRELGIRMPERDLGLRLMSAGRPHIDGAARRIVAGYANVGLFEATRVVDLAIASGAVAGVVAEDATGRRTIGAELVVDATGPAGTAVRWYSQYTGRAPSVATRRPDQWYVTVTVVPPPSRRGGNRFWLVFPTAPRSRGGLVSPSGTGHWHVSLSGQSQDPIPRSVEEMVVYAATLEDPVVSELLRCSTPLGEPNTFRKVNASWQRFDLVEQRIRGLLPLGDAIASLNPLFGQGVSVAAWQAAILADLVADPATAGDVALLSASYLARSAEPVSWAWRLGELVSTALTTELDGVRVDLTPALATLVAEDPDVHRRYVSIWHLLEPASTLQSPDIAGRLVDLASKEAPT